VSHGQAEVEARTYSFDDLDVPLAWARNPYILKWWTDRQDEAIRQAIERWAWLWPWEVVEDLVLKTEPTALTHWRAEDPKCRQFAWYNVLMYFAIARARTVDLEEGIRKPAGRTCLLCASQFREDTISPTFYKRIEGPDRLDFCPKCMANSLYPDSERSSRLSVSDIEAYAVRLAAVTGSVPPQNYFDLEGSLTGWADQTRIELLQLALDRPLPPRIKETHGSWLAVLIASGVLPDGTQRMPRGVRCIAADGHVCLSLAEKTIDDWLTSNGVAHEKEPGYPESRLRADFKVGEVLIEYFGLAGNAAYDAKIVQKRAIAERFGIRLIELFPRDMAAWRHTQTKLARVLGLELATPELGSPGGF
jgi:hypothetical protein